MVVQAQALGATDERVREATDAIADLGRRTMADLHRTLRVLRGDEATPGAPARRRASATSTSWSTAPARPASR